MPVITPEICENAITIPFGLSLRLIQVNGYEATDVTLIQSPEDSVFYGLFDFEDTDFKIIIKNQYKSKNFGLDISVRNSLKRSFYIKRGSSCSLETNYKHLHFFSQKTDKGKALVAMSANRNNTSYDEESINCSRIGFTLEVEEEKIKTESLVKSPVKSLVKSPVKFTVKTMCGKAIELTVDINCLVKDVKYLIQEKEGIPCGQQRLFIFDTILKDEEPLSQYEILNGTLLHLILSLRGGRAEHLALPEPQTIGETGVVCFGKQTQQKFCTYNGFKASKEYEIKPFTIELRMKSKN